MNNIESSNRLPSSNNSPRIEGNDWYDYEVMPI